jgi:methyltransferase (TIGR00027 family)
MLDAQPSHTAERVAIERAAHQLIDRPLVLTDPLAMQVIDAAQAARLRAHPERHDVSPVARPTRAIVVVRSRLAEDEMARAAASGVTQYVLLGAGLDTFAYRNPHPAVRVFEVDHPATQQLKRERLARAGIEIPERVAFVAHDFARQTLPEALRPAGFDASRPAVFAWLGVVMYLERDAVLQTLRTIASLPAGTAVVFDYAVPPASLGWIPRLFYRQMLKRLAAQGEPWTAFFEPGPLSLDLADAGFTQIDDLGPSEINTRILGGRSDGLKAGPVGRIVIARR